jgi:hypothetical protein
MYIAGSSGTTVSITKYYNLNLQPGQTVIVNITVSDVSNMVSFRAHLAWDPNVLKVTTGDPEGWVDPITGIQYGIYEGPFFKNFSNETIFLVNRVNNVAGNITGIFNAFTASGVSASGTGVIAIINFTCVNTGSTTIRIVGPREGHSSLQDSAQQQILHQDIDGLITNEAPPPIWTESWFQVAAGFGLIEFIILALMVFLIIRWWRTQSVPPNEENEEIFL